MDYINLTSTRRQSTLNASPRRKYQEEGRKLGGEVCELKDKDGIKNRHRMAINSPGRWIIRGRCCLRSPMKRQLAADESLMARLEINPTEQLADD